MEKFMKQIPLNKVLLTYLNLFNLPYVSVYFVLNVNVVHTDCFKELYCICYVLELIYRISNSKKTHWCYYTVLTN